MRIWPVDNRECTARDIGAFCGTRTRGVFSAEDNLQVTPGGGWDLKVLPGLAWLEMAKFWGVSVLVDVPVHLVARVDDASRTRWVACILRVDKLTGDPEVLLKYGTYVAGDMLPDKIHPMHNDQYDELVLASALQRARATGFEGRDVIDERPDPQFCGLMRDGVTRIPTDGLFAQLTDEWHHWFADVRQQLERDPAGYLKAKVDSLEQTIQSQAETINSLSTELQTLKNSLNNYITKEEAADFAVVQSFAAGHLVTDTYGNRQAKG